MVELSEHDLFLAFDFGTSKTGVAVGQKMTRSSTALAPLRTKNGVPQWSEVDQLVKVWQPKALVVGVPLTLDGHELRVTKLAERFIVQLKARYGLEVYAAEERLTTKAARADIFARGGYRALQKESVDSVAAQLILEEWMS